MTNRWSIAIAGVLLQVALGAVYAWSVFRVPLTKQFGWSISEVTFTFTISIFVLGIAAFFGGLWLNRKGPRIVAVTGGFLYGLGVFLASFSDHKLWWLYLTYGVLGGAGAGLSYIVPVAVLVKWFPDRRGLITGVAVGGFGAGALVTAPVATRLIQRVGVLPTFAYLGIALLVVTVVTGYFMRNPPFGWKPEGWTPTAAQAAQRSGHDYTLGEALRTWQWWALWLLLFLNTSAGISVIAQESPLFQQLARVSVVAAASMVGVASIGNALGRVFWAWASDSITRRATFVVMFLAQAVLFWTLPSISSVALVTLVAFVILMCYGGGFGTMPAFAADYFGSKNVGPIYGLMLTAWGFASAFGPLLIAHMQQSSGVYRGALHVIAGIMAVSVVLPLIVSPPRQRGDQSALFNLDEFRQRRSFMRLVDKFGRAITDLRISITDRCNYKCVYCRSGNEGAIYGDLPFADYLRMSRLLVGLGIRKIRITGGEPLLRKGVIEFVSELAKLRHQGLTPSSFAASNGTAEAVPFQIDLAITTNGHLLAEMAKPLKDAGLRRVTVSMDAIDADQFVRMARVPDGLRHVLAGIRAAQRAGLAPVKINCVLMRGFNDDQIVPFGKFAREEGVVVRFIEFMPLEEGRVWSPDVVVPMNEIVRRMAEYLPLVEIPRAPSETARRYTFEDGVGEIGIIAPVSRPFCGHCSRIRMTSDGKIRTCLFSVWDHDLHGLMRRGASDHELVEFIRTAVGRKEERHHIGEASFVPPSRTMVHIGG